MTKELKKKILSIVAIVVLGCILIGSGAWIGWTAGRKYPENIAVSEATNIAPNASTTSAADFNTFWAAWADIQNESLWTPSTTPTQRMYGAITGMVGSLGDPYTEFFTPADSSQFQEDITGNFGGIGAELGENSSTEIVVIEAISSTPAFAAGLKPEDIITSINGSSTASMNIDDAVNLIRGTVGTNVTLGILRQGWTAPKSFTITRANIQVPTVEFSMKGDIAYIQLNEFTQDADDLFFKALQNAVNANAKGIVLDLRGDPGGYLQVAVDISGFFLKPGSPVVKEVGRTVPEQDYTASGSGALVRRRDPFRCVERRPQRSARWCAKFRKGNGADIGEPSRRFVAQDHCGALGVAVRAHLGSRWIIAELSGGAHRRRSRGRPGSPA